MKTKYFGHPTSYLLASTNSKSIATVIKNLGLVEITRKSYKQRKQFARGKSFKNLYAHDTTKESDESIKAVYITAERERIKREMAEPVDLDKVVSLWPDDIAVTHLTAEQMDAESVTLPSGPNDDEIIAMLKDQTLASRIQVVRLSKESIQRITDAVAEDQGPGWEYKK